MNVVGHQYIGMNGAIRLRCGKPQIVQVVDLVAVGEEACLTIHAANDHVLRNARNIQARQSSHGRRP